MVLIDANVLMYAATIDAETLQEILHRYRAIRRWKAGRQVFDLARQLFPSVVPISVELLDRARALLDDYAALMECDALHTAVVMHEGFDAICSYDRDFDVITTLSRIEP
jgi:predicted nucleic acid-binding protein